MDQIGWFLYDREDAAALEQEQQARVHGKDVAHEAVSKVARVAGDDDGVPQPSAPGVAFHYALGILPGALYAVARHEYPAITAAQGLWYGVALWALQDEVVAPLLGFASPPQDYPWQAHARGLASHVVLGMAIETVLDLLDPVE
jgi:hypothetical protein